MHDALAADGAPEDEFIERVMAQLWRIAPGHGADDVTLASAVELLRELVTDHSELGAELLADSARERLARDPPKDRDHNSRSVRLIQRRVQVHGKTHECRHEHPSAWYDFWDN